VLVLLAISLYLPLFFFNVAWFLPVALLPRGGLSELLASRWPPSEQHKADQTQIFLHGLGSKRRGAPHLSWIH
jgi:hypothetical protein